MLDRTTPPAIQQTAFSFRKPTERILDNGTPLYIIETEGLDAVRIDFVFSAGQLHQSRKLQALFACRMLREGCRGYSAAEFAERLDYFGAWLELSVSMGHSFVTLYTLKKHFAPTIELVQRMLTEPTYSEEQFHTVCANNKARLLVSLQKGDVQAMRALRHSIYGAEHPCGMNVTPEDYDTLRVTDAIDFYHRYYGSRTCQIYLSGDIDNALLEHVETLFGREAWGNGERVESGKIKVKSNLPAGGNNQLPSNNFQLDTQFISHPTAVQDSIRMGYLLMDVTDADYLPMRVLTAVLGGYFGSRLMKNIREEKGYTYHIGSDLVTNTSQALFIVHCEAQAGKAKEIIDEVCREMQRLQTEPITDDELHMVRNYMTGEICRNYESAFALTDAYIFIHNLGLPTEHIEHTIEAIRTTDEAHLQQLAQRYLHPEMLHCVVVSSTNL
jgi:predicted Zn-dependent peptidase